MKKTKWLQRAWCALLGAALAFTPMLFGCDNGSGGGDGDSGSGGLEFSGYKWKVNNATVVNNGSRLVVTPKAGGIVMQLADSELAALYAKYPAGFAVTAKIRPVSVDTESKAACFAKDAAKNIGVVANIAEVEGSTRFYGGFINYNGRTQLGSSTTPKGVQFGSMISDPENKIFKQAIDEPYVVRLEVKEDDKISMYVNGIVSEKSGSTEYSIPDAAKVTRSATVGSYGILTEYTDPFEIYSFKVEGLNEGKASILMQTTDTNFAVLTSKNSKKYVFLNESVISPRVGDADIDFDVSAIDGAGEVADFNVVSSDDSIASVTKNTAGTGFTLSILAEGNAVITVTNGSDETVARKINVVVRKALVQTDTEYTAMATAFYPQGDGVYEDDHLKMTFDEEPTLVEGSIYIYDFTSDELVDEIKIGSDSNEISDGTSNKQRYVLKNFMVQVDDKTVEIIPHFGKLENNKKYYVVIGNGSITGNVGGQEFTGFAQTNKRWTFTTRAAKPSVTTAVRVGSSATADFRTVQGAIAAMSSGATITVEEGTYREIIYNKSKAATIIGDTATDYGADVVIQGINCNAYNGSTQTRAAVYWAGGDLRMKNITIQNAYDRNVDGTAQSEAIYFASGEGKKLVAYNCSFLGYQDTIQSSGKNWFYKCYIEGDTDFIWGTASVALFEECKVKMLNTKNDKVPSSEAFIFETRVAGTGDPVIPKGYVMFNSEIEATHAGGNYLARRASGKSTTSYFDQAAFIDDKFTGTPGLSDKLWGGPNVKSDKNEPEFLAKDSDGNMHVGWKIYGGEGWATSGVNAENYFGTISSTVYTAEYSNRNLIMNRVYKKASNSYQNTDSIWNLTAEATALGFTLTTPDTELPVEVQTTFTFDFHDVKYSSADAVNTDYGTHLTWAGAGQVEAAKPENGIKVGADTVITMKVAGKVDVYAGCQLPESDLSVTYKDGKATIKFVAITGSYGDYIGKIVLDTADIPEDTKTAAVTDFAEGTVTVSPSNRSNKITTQTISFSEGTGTIKYSSSKTAVATVDETSGEVTIVAPGFTTITATVEGTETSKKYFVVVEPEASESFTWTSSDFNDCWTAGDEVFNTLKVSGVAKHSAPHITISDNATIYVPVDATKAANTRLEFNFSANQTNCSGIKFGNDAAPITLDNGVVTLDSCEGKTEEIDGVTYVKCVFGVTSAQTYIGGNAIVRTVN